jgi:hypothetical protein
MKWRRPEATSAEKGDQRAEQNRHGGDGAPPAAQQSRQDGEAEQIDASAADQPPHPELADAD